MHLDLSLRDDLARRVYLAAVKGKRLYSAGPIGTFLTSRLWIVTQAASFALRHRMLLRDHLFLSGGVKSHRCDCPSVMRNVCIRILSSLVIASRHERRRLLSTGSARRVVIGGLANRGVVLHLSATTARLLLVVLHFTIQTI